MEKKQPKPQHELCQKCGGYGFLPEVEAEVKCPDCGGTGWPTEGAVK